MLDLMQTKLGVIVNTVNAGKCGRSQNWYEPPVGHPSAARRCIRVEGAWRCCCEMRSWGVAGDFCENWVNSQEITLQKLSEHTNMWVLRIILRYNLGVNEIGEK